MRREVHHFFAAIILIHPCDVLTLVLLSLEKLLFVAVSAVLEVSA